jgi:hypothetical protein
MEEALNEKMEDELKTKWKTTSKKMEEDLQIFFKNVMENEPINQNQSNWLFMYIRIYWNACFC